MATLKQIADSLESDGHRGWAETINEQTTRIVKAIQQLVAAENRHKFPIGDDKWTDKEMATRKRDARDNAMKILKEYKELL